MNTMQTRNQYTPPNSDRLQNGSVVILFVMHETGWGAGMGSLKAVWHVRTFHTGCTPTHQATTYTCALAAIKRRMSSTHLYQELCHHSIVQLQAREKR
jgi:hypothetical protein